MSAKKNLEEWLSREETAEYIGLSIYWLHKHANTGKGPEYIRIGRKSWYRRADLDSWLKSLKAQETAPAATAKTLQYMSGYNQVKKPLKTALRDEYNAAHGETQMARKAQRRLARRKLWSLLSDAAKSAFEEYEAV